MPQQPVRAGGGATRTHWIAVTAAAMALLTSPPPPAAAQTVTFPSGSVYDLDPPAPQATGPEG